MTTAAGRAGQRSGARRTAPAWRALGTLALRGGGGEPVDLARTLASHGVASLPPQLVDEAGRWLEATVATGTAGPRTIRVRKGGKARAVVEVAGAGWNGDEQLARRLVAVARELLALDEDLSPFYQRAAGDPALSWATAGAGRMLRGATVFEDVVKTICTTNCAWSATVRMVTAMVETLGDRSPDGRHAFPSPATLAQAGEPFFRDVARAGYRGASLHRLAAEVAEGRLDLEVLRGPEVPDDEVERRLLALPGVGPYAAAHVMLTSLGRYRQLIFDSWTRPTYARITGRKASDATIERRFRNYGDYAGLAYWLFVTRHWLEQPVPAG